MKTKQSYHLWEYLVRNYGGYWARHLQISDQTCMLGLLIFVVLSGALLGLVVEMIGYTQQVLG